ncbi:hypothetical protein JZ785_02460 [Alicyclobacillus curvatus]|nr:hypothetical protein JZ785_02460 [Alicyclobacillus curvatus]
MSTTSTPAQKQGDDEHVETNTFHLNLDGVMVSVTCNRPSASAITNFTKTLHTILLNLFHENEKRDASLPSSHE